MNSGRISYLLDVQGKYLFPESKDTYTMTGIGKFAFSDFTIDSYHTNIMYSRFRVFLRNMNILLMRLVCKSRPLPSRIQWNPEESVFVFHATETRQGSDILFGVSLLSLIGIEARTIGLPNGLGFNQIRTGYYPNELGSVYWGGSSYADEKELEMISRYYDNRTNIPTNLRNAIEILNISYFSPDEDIRNLLCITAFEAVAGYPPSIFEELRIDKTEKRSILRAVEKTLFENGISSEDASRIRGIIGNIQARSTREHIQDFSAKFGIILNDEEWKAFFKLRNSLAHGQIVDTSVGNLDARELLRKLILNVIKKYV